MKSQQMKFLAGAQKSAVLDVLGRHIDQRQCVRLGIR
jgi:hypothetical protein